MSTPAQVTEAHRKLSIAVWAAVKWDETPCGAQLIADSEAAALSSLAMVAAGSADRNVSLRLENDQLRAEVKRLARGDREARGSERDLRQILDTYVGVEARAESAEREVERLKHGTVAQFKDAFIDELKRENTELRVSCDEHAKGYVETRKRIAALESEIDRLHAINAVRESAIARAERAEAELATLRKFAEQVTDRNEEMAKLRAEVKESKERERVAIASWDEERQRALREGGRVVELRAEVAALVITKDKACAAAVENKAEADGLRRALADAISTYDPNRKQTLVTAERQEAWIAALQEDAK